MNPSKGGRPLRRLLRALSVEGDLSRPWIRKLWILVPTFGRATRIRPGMIAGRSGMRFAELDIERLLSGRS